MLPFVLGTLGMMAGTAISEGGIFGEKGDPEQFNVKEAADRLNVSELTIKRRIKKGELKADIVDGKYIISRDELYRFMDNSPRFSPRYNSMNEKKIVYDSQGGISEAIQTFINKLDEISGIGENPEKCQDFIKRLELLKQKDEIELQRLDIELKILELDKKQFKDDNNVLKKLERRKCNCELAKVQLFNDVNTLTFMLDKANGKKE